MKTYFTHDGIKFDPYKKVVIQNTQYPAKWFLDLDNQNRAGVYTKQVVKPYYNPLTQTITQDYYGDYIVKDLPTEVAKTNKIKALADERFKRETMSVRINGNLYATEDRSKLLITGVSDLADNAENQDEIRTFKTADSNGKVVYYDLPVWEALQVKRLGGEYVQKCFDEERRLVAGVEKGEDLTPNWPSREYIITREEAVAKRLTRAEVQKRVKTLESKSTINYEVLKGVTGSNGSVVLQYEQPLKELIDMVPKLSWAGNQAVVPYIKEQTNTSVTLGAKQSRASLLLSSGPFQEAPNGTEVSIAIIGKV